MLYWFWDLMNDESCGLLRLDNEPEIGDIITSGFIRNNPTAKWEVIRKDEDHIYVVLECCKKYL